MLGITDLMAASGGAQAPASLGESLMGMMPMLMAMFGLFYFMIIRPQSKKAREHKSLIDNLKVGDEVLTNGGLVAIVASIDETLLRLTVSPNVNITVKKTAIGSVLPKGTLESARS